MGKLVIALSLLIFSAPVFAAGRIDAGSGAAASGKTAAQEKRAAADAMHLEILEVEALYWARRIAVVRDISYDGLYANSERWVMGGEVRDKLFSRIKEILDSGAARDLTDEEHDRYDTGLERIRTIFGNNVPKTPQQLRVKAGREEIDVISRRIMDVEARYWAWRISVVKDINYEDLSGKSKNWIGKTETKKELFRKIKELLDSGEARALTAEEKARYDDGKARIRAILKADA
jgi:hypothetical protein